MGTAVTHAPPRQPDPSEPVPPERELAPPAPPRLPRNLLTLVLILAVVAAASLGWALRLQADATRLSQENAALRAEVSTFERLLGDIPGDEGDIDFGFDLESARPLEPGTVVSVDGTGPRTFEVASVDGDLLIATVEPAAPELYLELQLYDGDGRGLGGAWAEDVDAELLTLHHLFVGEDPVYLVANPYGGEAVVLSIEVVELGPSVRVLDVELRADELPASHLLEAVSGDVLDVRLGTSGDVDPLVTIHGPDQELLAENDDSGETLDSRSIAVVAEDGTHTIVADSVWSDDPAAALRLTVDVSSRTSER